MLAPILAQSMKKKKYLHCSKLHMETLANLPIHLVPFSSSGLVPEGLHEDNGIQYRFSVYEKKCWTAATQGENIGELNILVVYSLCVREFSISKTGYPGFQRFLALGELRPKSRAAGGWGWGEAEARKVISAPALQRDTSCTSDNASGTQIQWVVFILQETITLKK